MPALARNHEDGSTAWKAAVLSTIPPAHLWAALPPAPPDQSLDGLLLLHFTDWPASSLQPPAHTVPQAAPRARHLHCNHLPPLPCMQTGPATCTTSIPSTQHHSPPPEPKGNQSCFHLVMEMFGFAGRLVFWSMLRHCTVLARAGKTIQTNLFHRHKVSPVSLQVIHTSHLFSLCPSTLFLSQALPCAFHRTLPPLHTKNVHSSRGL